MGGPTGVSIKNRIPVSIGFSTPVTFDIAFDGLLALVRYFELIIGRQQNVLSIGVVVGDGASPDHYLNVDWSMAPQREVRSEDRRQHPGDVLLGPVADPAKFGMCFLRISIESRNGGSREYASPAISIRGTTITWID
jgi:hypothetical protein